MSEALTNYFSSFFHPFQLQKELRLKRFKQFDLQSQLLPFKLNDLDNESEIGEIDNTETLTISWLFVCINALYSILALNLGLTSTYLLTGTDEFSIAAVQKFSAIDWIIFTVLLEIVLFPIVYWFYLQFWTSIIKFFAKIFNLNDHYQDAAPQVVQYAFTSYTFMLIPIFGPMIQWFAFIIYIYAGLRNNLQFNFLQSIFIILSPLIIFCLLILLFTLLMSLLLFTLFPTLFSSLT